VKTTRFTHKGKKKRKEKKKESKKKPYVKENFEAPSDVKYGS